MNAPDWYSVDVFYRWPYGLERPVHYRLRKLGGAFTFHRMVGPAIPLARYSVDGILTILPGYRWDGATFAPDIAKLMRAVLLHDFLCQICERAEWPIRRFEADRCFYTEARKDAPVLAAIYYAGIRIGGGLHRAFNPPTPEETLIIRPA